MAWDFQYKFSHVSERKEVDKLPKKAPKTWTSYKHCITFFTCHFFT